MQVSHRSVLSSAALAMFTVVSVAAPAQAAPADYRAAVIANNPYVYYRLAETGTLTNAAAQDSSPNTRADGIYRGNPTGGIAGQGAGSDTAVSFPGTTLTGLDYLRTTDTLAFGSQVPRSSYEFVFKSNVANPTNQQAIFGIFSAADSTTGRTGNEAVSIELNTANSNNALNTDMTRMYLRDEAGVVMFGNIEHGDLLDGAYHHFVVTVDLSAANVSDKIMAYVDGIAVPVTVGQSAGGAPSDFRAFTRDPVFAARNVRGTVGLEADITLDEAALYGNTVLTPAQVAAHATAAGFVVPEPGSLALAGIAALGLLVRRRRHT
ncbi:MAG TPA: PEP-CTERM sorting domain-containing protein [Tepidisphaeraceae bacterium]|nr:PEP-CTERM sorting domain-containing protein [Tepidisphaeraceae bacterium]